ncbi:Uncharacterized protein SCF082_LOCUS3000 [Durusdinium trenchii]|uniref:Uncharacterized protein n=1 Tax=Durusdinium trenchii TaxID=1381693 RepID=A0ABP0HPT0_9DINO
MRSLGASDPLLDEIGRAGPTSKKKFRNVSRNFHAWINRTKKVLPVKVSTVKLRVLERRPRLKQVEKNFPMIGLKSWAEYLLEHSPKFLLAGHSLEDHGYEETFRLFWERYFKLDGNHPVYQNFNESSWGSLVPYCLHGDEGRGKAKRPVLITSYQMIIPQEGLGETNMKGYLS